MPRGQRCGRAHCQRCSCCQRRPPIPAPIATSISYQTALHCWYEGSRDVQVLLEWRSSPRDYGANVEIAEGVGSENVLLFFGHLTPAVKELRYQHKHHPVPVEEKSRDKARVLGPGFIKTFRRWKCVRAVRS
ncbi:hypothetical protein EDD17DRAFT_819210 [Pisolithus thermaeus]|nr:hypothetical protein EDD17DRAFT_819210 [Pisolithus thermaeus]